MLSELAVVVIGRNEALRLNGSLASIPKHISHVVYVDSGSTDDSLEIARSYSCLVHSLSNDKPFSAARARNEGLNKVIEINPSISYVQFIDGDCILSDRWLAEAAHYLEENKNYAIVCGRRKEIHMDNNLYHSICDIEWNLPVGDLIMCGGDFLCRVAAFKAVNGFDPEIVAGEEPELCYRLRQLGWKIRRIDCPMTYHDASIYSLRQFLIRINRSGYATTLWFFKYGHGKERFQFREFLRIIFWGLIYPIIYLISLCFSLSLFLLLNLIYVLQIFRIFRRVNKEYSARERVAYAITMIFGKPYEFLGAAKYVYSRFSKNSTKIFEYK